MDFQSREMTAHQRCNYKIMIVLLQSGSNQNSNTLVDLIFTFADVHYKIYKRYLKKKKTWKNEQGKINLEVILTTNQLKKEQGKEIGFILINLG